MRWLVIDYSREDCYAEKFRLFDDANNAMEHAPSRGWADGGTMGELFAFGPPDQPGVVSLFRCGDINLEIVCLRTE